MKKLLIILLLLPFIGMAQTGEVKPSGTKLLQTPNNATFSWNVPDSGIWINMGSYGTTKLMRSIKAKVYAPLSVYPATGLTTGYLPYKTASVLANSPIWTDGTRVRIGDNWGSTDKLSINGYIASSGGYKFGFGSYAQFTVAYDPYPSLHTFFDFEGDFKFRSLDGYTLMMILKRSNKNIGIKVAEPTASLHLPVGTATATTAPLKFTSGVNLTTPEAGAMEYDGTNLYFTPSAARKTFAFTDQTLDSHGNVSITSKQVNDILKWNGTNWVNTPIPSSGGSTNLAYTASATNGIVESDSGTDATIPAGSTTNASLMLPADKTKLNGIATGADNYNSWGISVNGGASAGAVSSGNIVNIYGSGGITTSRSGNDITVTGSGGSMVYPNVGIPLSTGSAWGTSITDNSANWNTAYGWGNHAGLYTPIANNGKVYASGSGVYAYLSANDFFYNAGSGTVIATKTDLWQNGNNASLTSNGAYNLASEKQANLISGTNIKTINGNSLLGAGDLSIAGSGTVTSVNMTTPTGLTVAGAPITTSGTLALSFTTGYSIPTNANQSLWTYTYDNFGTKANLSGAAFTGAISSTSTMTATDFILSSDRRLKQNITNIESNPSRKIDFVQYQLKSDPTKLRYGVIAQQVKRHMPELVHEDEKGMLSVSYIDLLIAKIADLENRIKKLENEK